MPKSSALQAPRGTFSRALFTWRCEPSFHALEAAVLALYACLLAFTLPRHEPWADEAQAWIIARDNSFWQIYTRRLHYEGSPPLWHFLLRTLHLLHMPYGGLVWFAAIAATAGIFVWLRWSPFPPVLRAVVPLSFWFQYQYAVVARSYVLFPLLLFGLCALVSRKRTQPWVGALTAGLLALLCLQGLIVAVVLSAVLIARRLWPVAHSSFSKRRLAPALLIVCFAAAIYPVIPAPDVGFAIGSQVSSGWAHEALLTVIGNDPNAGPRILADPADLEYLRLPQPLPPKPASGSSLRSRLGWNLRHPAPDTPLGTTATNILFTVVDTLSKLFWPLAESSLLAAACLLAMLAWFYQRRALLLLLPALALLGFEQAVWSAGHNAGLLLITLLGSAWLAHTSTVPRASPSNPDSGPTINLERAFLFLLTLVLALQLFWTAHAIRSDRDQPYDPSRETAAFLHTQPGGLRVAGFHFWSEGLQPYFARNPFFNVRKTWWSWNRDSDTDNEHRQVLDSRPDFVVYTIERQLRGIMSNQIVPLIAPDDNKQVDPILLNLASANYRETHRFCGERFSRMSASYQVCDVIFEPPAR